MPRAHLARLVRWLFLLPLRLSTAAWVRAWGRKRTAQYGHHEPATFCAAQQVAPPLVVGALFGLSAAIGTAAAPVESRCRSGFVAAHMPETVVPLLPVYGAPAGRAAAQRDGFA